MIRIGASSICLIHVPGHSPDSIVFYFPGKSYLFVGDTLFQGSVGRTDLPGGDESQLLNGIAHKLLVLNRDVYVFPGHGESTTIGDERDYNRFFRHLEIHTEGISQK